MLFWVLNAVKTPQRVLVSNAIRYWSNERMSIFPTTLQSRVLDITRNSTCYKVAATAMLQERGGLPLQGPLPWRSAPTLHPFLRAARSMELRRSSTAQNSDCHRAAGSVAVPHTILRKIHGQRLFTV